MADFVIKTYVEYRVTDHDTLDSVARGLGLTWQDLARFNFNTTDPGEVNACLQRLVGCTKKTADGRNWVFTSQDDPGIIFLPTKKPLPLVLSTGKSYQVQLLRPKYKPTVYRIRLFDPFNRPMPKAPFRVEVGGRQFSGTANDDGWLEFASSVPRERCLLEWGEPKEYERYATAEGEESFHQEEPVSSDYEYCRELYLELAEDDDESCKRRLHNLGLSWHDEIDKNLELIGLAYGSVRSREELRQWHDSCAVNGWVAT